METPEVFGNRLRAAMAADATIVNLNDLCPHFFQFGKRLVAMCVLASRM